MSKNEINFPVKFKHFEEIINGKLWYIELPVQSGQCEILKIEKGATLQKHFHTKNDFQILIIKGRGLAIEGKRGTYYSQGIGFTIPKGTHHGFIAMEETIMYSESTGQSEGDTEYITENYPLYEIYQNPYFSGLLDLKLAKELYANKKGNIGNIVIDYLGALPRKMLDRDKKLIMKTNP